MAGLLEPYVPNVGSWLSSATQGYALGNDMRKRNLLSQAGGLAAGGNLKGARNALYAGGELDEGYKLDDRMIASAQRADAKTLEKAKRFNDMIGSLAMAADTPEKWAKAITTAKGMGLDVSKYGDFGARDVALAQAGKTNEMLTLELQRRREDREANKPFEVGNSLVAPQPGGGYKTVFTAPAKPEGLRDVAPGNTVFDPNSRQPIYTAPEKPQPTYDFTKTGVGNKFSGEFKPYAPGAGEDPEVTTERGKYEQGLRKEYTTLSSDLRTYNDSLGRMRTASKANSGAGDIAMVYSYMKMLDPTSVVREGEYATAEQTGGLPERVVNVYNKILSGQRLTPEQRRQFLESGEALAGDKEKRFQKLRGQFEDIARKSGVDPARIMLDEGMSQSGEGGNHGGGNIDLGAIQMLRRDPSPDAQREFDEIFGPGASRRVLGR